MLLVIAAWLSLAIAGPKPGRKRDPDPEADTGTRSRVRRSDDGAGRGGLKWLVLLCLCGSLSGASGHIYTHRRIALP